MSDGILTITPELGNFAHCVKNRQDVAKKIPFIRTMEPGRSVKSVAMRGRWKG
jgi:hypothetical protein